VTTLPDGPLDVVGDVHGEHGALLDLMTRLGYDAAGHHADQRRLVFVGDLCDRGPDSPAVIETVMALVNGGKALCVLGNHELNLLRESRKLGNGWFFAADHDQARGRYLDCRPATDEQRSRFAGFFAGLPLALTRQDLRVVHAAWHPESLAALQDEARPLLTTYRHYQDAIEGRFRAAGLPDLLREEYQTWGPHLEDPARQLPLLPGVALSDELFQMSNPVRVVTSGVECQADAPFFASGKWRMVQRVPWWQSYSDDAAVLFGHYWRWTTALGQQRFTKGAQDLFARVAPSAWLGPRRNAFCLDFSVGARHRERPLAPGARYLGRLGAVRWPESQLVFDDGETLALK
jgi:Calcineurin-like phosphoesterase